MSEAQEVKPEILLPVALCLLLLSISGCIGRIPGARSSLSPRTANVGREDVSTVRSQSDKLPGNWTAPLLSSNGAAGHSGLSNPSTSSDASRSSDDTAEGPVARLLTPMFKRRDANEEPTVGDSRMEGAIQRQVSAESDVERGTRDSLPPVSAFGTTTARSAADQIRSMINRKSSNEMSQSDVLTDREVKWQVLSRSGPAVASENSAAPSASPSEADRAFRTPPLTVRTATFDGQVTPVAETGNIIDSVPAQEGGEGPGARNNETEPSVFDRLRGLYEPAADAGPRQTWKEQFQRLQPSWSPFREREDSAGMLPPEPVQEIRELATDKSETLEAISPVLQQLITETIDELSNWPGLADGTPNNVELFTRRHQDLRLLQLVANRPGEAIAAIEIMPGAEQDFWQELMLGLAQYRSLAAEPDRELALTNAAGQLTSAVRRLAPAAALRCRRLDICSRIFSYGRIETFPSNDFEPGQPILLYAELENFATRATATGTRLTSFDAQLQILHDDESAGPIETIDLSGITDEASSERSDYYQSFELTVPSHLARGTYHIRVRLRDRISGKATAEVVSFQVR
ncbi:MAG: hypothetical protein P8J37_21520 [Fuerstiella sp.]|nr:hypothetical protein [Fuerstiella sp.]